MKNLLLAVVAVTTSVVGVVVFFFVIRHFDVRNAQLEARQLVVAITDRVDRCERRLSKTTKEFQSRPNKSQNEFESVLYGLAVEEDDFLWAEWLVPETDSTGTERYKVLFSTHEDAAPDDHATRQLNGALSNATSFEQFEIQLENQSGVFLSKRLFLEENNRQGVLAAVRPVFNDQKKVTALAVGYFRTILSPTKPNKTDHICMKIFRLDSVDGRSLVVSEGGPAEITNAILRQPIIRGCEKYQIVFCEKESQVARRSGFALFGLVLGPVFVCTFGRYYWKQTAEQFRSQCSELSDEVSERREIQRTLQSLLALRDSERRTVSSDIHDGFVQEALSAQMFLDALVSRIDERDPQARELLGNLKHSLEQAITEGRRLISRNQVLAVDDYGFLPALQRLIVNQREKFNVDITLRYEDDLPELDILQQRCLYRIIQESLANIRRHSGSNIGMVTLYTTPGWFHVDIADQGSGFDTDAVRISSYGIRGMQERMAVIGGELTIKSSDGVGTLVSARMPLSYSVGEGSRIVGDDRRSTPNSFIRDAAG